LLIDSTGVDTYLPLKTISDSVSPTYTDVGNGERSLVTKLD